MFLKSTTALHLVA